MSAEFAARLEAVRARIGSACERAGRRPEDVTLVGVAKKHPAQAIRTALGLGVQDIGENYVQELLQKDDELAGLELRWHFVGRLQRNKAKLLVGRTALIHALDSLELAEALNRRAQAVRVVQRVLLAVNVSEEATKAGVSPEAAGSLLSAIEGLEHVTCEGLMTMPPMGDPEVCRPYFRALRELRDRLATGPVPLPQLSMGMSGDLEVAVEEGATLVRVGTALFGPRPG